MTQGSVALIGDASGSVDAITGLGVGLAFRQALALADALAASDPAQYEAAHRRIFRGPRWMARALLVMDRYPALGMNLLHRNRDMFHGLLASHSQPSLD